MHSILGFWEKTVSIRFSAQSLQISKITPELVKLLSDPTGQVTFYLNSI